MIIAMLLDTARFEHLKRLIRNRYDTYRYLQHEIDIMKPDKNTPAYHAYNHGKEAKFNGYPESYNPYVTRRTIALKNWWLKGYNEENKSK